MQQTQANQQEEIASLRAQLRETIATAYAAGTITAHEQFVIEQRFALGATAEHQTYDTIAKNLQISHSRVGQIQSKALLRLRALPSFFQTMNQYLRLVPYPVGTKRPYWLTEEGLLQKLPRAAAARVQQYRLDA